MSTIALRMLFEIAERSSARWLSPGERAAARELQALGYITIRQPLCRDRTEGFLAEITETGQRVVDEIQEYGDGTLSP